MAPSNESRTRISADERREHILRAVIPLVASKGMNGVTTRELAAAAGVSEALLYKHFPSKASLNEAMHELCVQDTSSDEAMLRDAEPGAECLAHAVHFLISKIVISPELGEERSEHLRRLMLGSLLGDGEFARGFLKRKLEIWHQRIVDCIRIAEETGELVPMDIPPETRLWMAEHMAVCIGMYRMPEEAVVDYCEEDLERLVRDVAHIALRGMGMRDEVIAKYLPPR